MKINVKNQNIKRIDDDRKVIEFDPKRCGKITGSRFLTVLGRDQYSTEFKAACQIARLFWEDTSNKYTLAGEAIEPIIRDHVRRNWESLLKERLGVTDGKISVEEPVDKQMCGYDHFKFNRIFGGMVDGYIKIDGKRSAILEIKTSNDPSAWKDDDGNYTKVPEGYYLQASLYAELSKLDRIVYAVGFLKEEDYGSPESFVPGDDNFAVVVVDKKDISEEMKAAESWYREYIMSGRTPEWKEADEELIDALTTNHIDLLPDRAMDMFRRYAKLRDADEDVSDMEIAIGEMLLPALKQGMRKVVYEQNGYRFTVDGNDGLLTVTRI